MKIAIFSDTFPPQINGVSYFVYRSAKSLAANGHSVTVFTVTKNFKDPLQSEQNNFKVVNLPSVPAMVYKGERFTIPTGASVIKLRKFNPDVIHAHTPFAMGWEAVWCAKMLKKPLVGTHHTFYDHYLKHAKMEYDWAKKFSWKCTVAFYNRFNLILSPTQSLADALIKTGLKKPVEIVPNSINTDLFRPVTDQPAKIAFKKHFNIPGKSIVYMGRVSYEKSIDQVVKAFALMLKKSPELKLMIIGDGPEKEKLKKLADRIGALDNIIFTGFLHREKLVEALQANDLYLTASKSENMPLSVLEAMATGLPIVTVKEKGLGEIVKENINGFFAQTDDPQDIAEKSLKLLSDNNLLKEFSENSRNLALEYSKDKVTAKLEEAYNKVIKKNI
jgi:1,2-diacylglycerol 3-alpha-glucosyltransferase